jgi:hypothetical protein
VLLAMLLSPLSKLYKQYNPFKFPRKNCGRRRQRRNEGSCIMLGAAIAAAPPTTENNRHETSHLERQFIESPPAAGFAMAGR